MLMESAYCCDDFRNFVAYLNTLNKSAGTEKMREYMPGRSNKFKLCPFCGTKLQTEEIAFDRDKDYVLKWDHELDTGVTWIDNQHRKLLEQLNLLINAIIHEDHYEVVNKSLKFLHTYVQAHFGTEEGLMQKHFFPGFESQRKQHSYFIKRLEEFSQLQDRKGPSREVAMQLAGELWRWFKEHIVKMDR